ncbi:MarR family winged helix-turn-helix transcriptional regulator [Ligilactobacillus apodemi]|uniref:MarR family transcriptional regulator n=1 Tax=Ligilactobacillus apodemi DSM 16634 = JCM 16172 TaxID=1423724 RepID=A0A0R1U3E0_9LACO|nr:MarR family transcriptional regulator [Ligilactobacillus apodemi]KRL87486.1 MarR family transcriptional regulator [Ligilactobacillus apodemi DSM 16634 = JCM 16172]MCR1901960.1 MarR family transcriptional regulator [Ligilactobacillus apodemi]
MPRIDKVASILNNKLRRELNFYFEKLGLSEANFFYLEILAEKPGLNQAYFINSLHREQSVVTRQINKLVAKGWIKKTKAKNDHRNSELYLTKKGEDILPTLQLLSTQISDEVLASLTPEEAETFARLLKKVALNYTPTADSHARHTNN